MNYHQLSFKKNESLYYFIKLFLIIRAKYKYRKQRNFLFVICNKMILIFVFIFLRCCLNLFCFGETRKKLGETIR